MTYDEWLQLSPEEQETEHIRWNTYAWENRHIPLEALRRLARSSKVPVLGGHVGLYHMGEYILNPAVDEKDLARVPAFLQSTFGGFRVGYIEFYEGCDEISGAEERDEPE